MKRYKRVKIFIIREKLYDWFETYHLRPFVEAGLENDSKWFHILRKQRDEKRRGGTVFGLGFDSVDARTTNNRRMWR